MNNKVSLTIVLLVLTVNLSVKADPSVSQVRDICWFLNRMSMVDHLPELENSHTAMSSTWDRSGNNADGGDFKRIEQNKNILLDKNGPGCIHRIFCGFLGEKTQYTRIRIFIDHNPKATFDMPINKFFDDENGPIPYPLVFYKSYPGVLFPIPFEKHILVQLTNEKYGQPGWKNIMWSNYWQVTYTTYPADTPVKTLSWPLSSQEEHQLKKTCARWLQAESAPPAEPKKWTISRKLSLNAKEATEITLNNCGLIKQMRITALPASPEVLRSLRMKIFWDGSANPSVDVPVGYFFGHADAGHGKETSSPYAVTGRKPSKEPVSFSTNYHSLLMGTTPSQAYCKFPMPFENGAVIRFENLGSVKVQTLEVKLDLEKRVSLPDNWGRFHATWTQDKAATQATPKLGSLNLPVKIALDRRCRGKYVGIMLQIVWPSDYWWGEGDWLIWTDEKDWPPSYHGTGSEEYFNSGWCRFDRKAVSGFVDLRPGYPTVYSFHLNDAFQFQRNIRVAEEQWIISKKFTSQPNIKNALWTTTAFWYALPAQPADSDK